MPRSRDAGLISRDDDPRWPRDVEQARARSRAVRAWCSRAPSTRRCQALAGEVICELARAREALFLVNDRFDLALGAARTASISASTIFRGADPGRGAQAAARRTLDAHGRAGAQRDGRAIDYVASALFATSTKDSHIRRGTRRARGGGAHRGAAAVVAIGGIMLPCGERDRGRRRRGMRDLGDRRRRGPRSRRARDRPRHLGATPPARRRARLTDLPLRLVSALGLAAMIAIAWGLSLDRRRMPWHTVLFGLGLQLAVAVVLVTTGAGTLVFHPRPRWSRPRDLHRGGLELVFGPLYSAQARDRDARAAGDRLPLRALRDALPLGLVQRVIAVLARVSARTLRTSGAESLCAAATSCRDGRGAAPGAAVHRAHDALGALLRDGDGHVAIAGSVMVVYAGMLGEGYAGHLPPRVCSRARGHPALESDAPRDRDTPHGGRDRGARRGAGRQPDRRRGFGRDRGAAAGRYVGAMLIAFVALIAMANAAPARGGWLGFPSSPCSSCSATGSRRSRG